MKTYLSQSSIPHILLDPCLDCPSNPDSSTYHVKAMAMATGKGHLKYTPPVIISMTAGRGQSGYDALCSDVVGRDNTGV